MPDDDHATHAALARIEAGQGYIQTELRELKDEQVRIRDHVGRIADEQTRGFGAAHTQIAQVQERLDGHMRDDDRRFDDARDDITRAHRKIGGVTTYGEDGSAKGSGKRPAVEAGKKAAWITGILSGLGALGAWIAEHLKGGGS